MKLSIRIMGAVVLAAASVGLMADEQVGASSMLCAVTSAVSCDSTGDCINGPASAVNLPVFVKSAHCYSQNSCCSHCRGNVILSGIASCSDDG